MMNTPVPDSSSRKNWFMDLPITGEPSCLAVKANMLKIVPRPGWVGVTNESSLTLKLLHPPFPALYIASAVKYRL